MLLNAADCTLLVIRAALLPNLRVLSVSLLLYAAGLTLTRRNVLALPLSTNHNNNNSDRKWTYTHPERETEMKMSQNVWAERDDTANNAKTAKAKKKKKKKKKKHGRRSYVPERILQQSCEFGVTVRDVQLFARLLLPVFLQSSGR